ncbi:AAA family ATPase [Parahaliea maris]|uniref:AAA family ATPase n=1 Tax=Parahaliea maris TaxID=2716870 RepID=A0A5C8ZQV3_9GAMM|nr:AAA family ATPase [Parahaliea maris]TXS89877.1 AAA family ATPase [Parahaliea maris]
MGKTSFFRALLLSFSIALPALAQPSGTGSASCRDAASLLDSLRGELASLNTRHDAIEAVENDNFPTDLSVEETIYPPAAVAGNGPREWPAEINCDALREEYQAALLDLQWMRESVRRLQAGWQTHPEVLRSAVGSIWRSRQALRSHYKAEPMAAALAIAPPEVRAAIENTRARLSTLRSQFLHDLPKLYKEVTPARSAAWLTLWQQAFGINPRTLAPSAEALTNLPAPARAAIERYFRLAELDIVVQRNSLNEVRGWLWQAYRPEVERARSQLGLDAPALLPLELRAVGNILHWLIIETTVGETYGQESGTTLRQWYLGFEYTLGILALPLLAYLASRLGAPLAALQANFARSARKQRLTAQFSRITASLPLLLPWVVGLIGLQLLHTLYYRYHLVLLIPLIPFARLYIVYGLLRLAGEWLLHRIADQAGSYLREEQNIEVARQSRRAAAVAILPWLVKDLAALALGPSLVLDICYWLTLFAVLLAIGVLLRYRREDFIAALTSILPASWEGAIKRLLGERRFPLVAPFAAPPLLLALLGSFMHKALFDFDWYRKLFARSFKLRTAVVEGDEAAEANAEPDAEALQDYQRWFLAEDDEADTPYINTGLVPAISGRMAPWLSDRSNENALLLTGPHGAGKTRALHRLQQSMTEEHPDVLLHYIAVPAKTLTAAALFELLGRALDIDLEEGPAALVRSDADRQPTVIMVDNAQNLFLRSVGGFEAWETLLSLTNTRLANVFWLIAVNNQSWAFLGNIFGRDQQFRNVLHTRRWSQNDVRSLILSRNHLSGCKIQYDSILLATRGPGAGNIRNAEQLYFSLLWDACLGNPMLALRLWLSSIRMQGSTVTVSLPAEVSGAMLEQLGNDLHFVYAAIMIHENMTSEELVEATALPESVVRSALKTAFDAGFVQRTANRRYRIVPLWYPTIMRLLARKNLLHE